MVESTRNGWQRFWDKGGWWRPFLLAIAYLVVFNLISLTTSTLFAGFIDVQNLTGSASSVFFALVLPILLTGILLFVFVVSLGWTREIFGRQPGRGSAWMWIAVVIVVIPILLRVFATNWGAYTIGTVLSTLLLGVCIGFAEELISRGVAVDLLRRGGFGERAVMLLSSAVFALLHATNLLSRSAAADRRHHGGLRVRVRGHDVPRPAGHGQHHLADALARGNRPDHDPRHRRRRHAR